MIKECGLQEKAHKVVGIFLAAVNRTRFEPKYIHMAAVKMTAHDRSSVKTLKAHKKGRNYDKGVWFARKGSQGSRVFLAAAK